MLWEAWRMRWAAARAQSRPSLPRAILLGRSTWTKCRCDARRRLHTFGQRERSCRFRPAGSHILSAELVCSERAQDVAVEGAYFSAMLCSVCACSAAACSSAYFMASSTLPRCSNHVMWSSQSLAFATTISAGATTKNRDSPSTWHS